MTGTLDNGQLISQTQFYLTTILDVTHAKRMQESATEGQYEITMYKT